MKITLEQVTLYGAASLRPECVFKSFSRRGWEELEEYFENAGLEEITDCDIDNLAINDCSEMTLSELVHDYDISLADFESEESFLLAAQDCGLILTWWQYDGEEPCVIVDNHASCPKEWENA